MTVTARNAKLSATCAVTAVTSDSDVRPGTAGSPRLAAPPAARAGGRSRRCGGAGGRGGAGGGGAEGRPAAQAQVRMDGSGAMIKQPSPCRPFWSRYVCRGPAGRTVGSGLPPASASGTDELLRTSLRSGFGALVRRCDHGPEAERSGRSEDALPNILAADCRVRCLNVVLDRVKAKTWNQTSKMLYRV